MFKHVFLPFKLNIQITVLFLLICEDGFLLIHFVSEVSDKHEVSFNSAFIVIVHSAFIVTQLVEVLFKSEELVLKGFVVSLLLAEFN